jgi:uncharacterized membrane protein YeaQ/YmgE (transglycosylase-associated protein family)
MINLIMWLVLGALIGWIASIVMRTDAQQGILLNVFVGIVGAAIGGFLFGANTINSGGFQPVGAARVIRRRPDPVGDR